MQTVLTIAGSDAGGGAGIQADLKTFEYFAVFGTSALSLVTAQNTVGVHEVHQLPAALVAAQISAVVDDLRPQAVKTGALGTAETIRFVAQALRLHDLHPLVVDPVAISKHGDSLLADDAVAVLRDELLPLATVLTPNRQELSLLGGQSTEDLDACRQAAGSLRRAGQVLVVTSVPGDATQACDLIVHDEGEELLTAERIDTTSTHGSGCTFSAAICAALAAGQEVLPAIRSAKAYVSGAIAEAPGLGSGRGPLRHRL